MISSIYHDIRRLLIVLTAILSTEAIFGAKSNFRERTKTKFEKEKVNGDNFIIFYRLFLFQYCFVYVHFIINACILIFFILQSDVSLIIFYPNEK